MRFKCFTSLASPGFKQREPRQTGKLPAPVLFAPGLEFILILSVYDYKNVDIMGLIQYIKDFDFESNVFCYPILQQTELFSNVLSEAFLKFVPSKTVTIKPTDAPWCTRFTRLLLRKKNRNYSFLKSVILTTEKP